MPKIMVFIFALLLEKLAEEIPTSAPRSKGKKRRSVSPVKILPSTQEIKNAASKAFSNVKNSMLGLHIVLKRHGRVMWKTRLEMKIKKKRKTLI